MYVVQELQDKLIELLYDDLSHPLATYIGTQYAYCKPDGSYNNISDPSMGKADLHSDSVQQMHPFPSSERITLRVPVIPANPYQARTHRCGYGYGLLKNTRGIPLCLTSTPWSLVPPRTAVFVRPLGITDHGIHATYGVSSKPNSVPHGYRTGKPAVFGPRVARVRIWCRILALTYMDTVPYP
ncbi:hypothetical protein F5888DRAFT_1383941 [Russula emetica]|nr:hypothetical protein F5888DRAFT_1383941 [Russula emetica]